MKKFFIGLVLISLLLILVSFSCGGGSGIFGSNSGHFRGNGQEVITPPLDATATFGADQWHIQLTEMAKPITR